MKRRGGGKAGGEKREGLGGKGDWRKRGRRKRIGEEG